MISSLNLRRTLSHRMSYAHFFVGSGLGIGVHNRSTKTRRKSYKNLDSRLEEDEEEGSPPSNFVMMEKMPLSLQKGGSSSFSLLLALQWPKLPHADVFCSSSNPQRGLEGGLTSPFSILFIPSLGPGKAKLCALQICEPETFSSSSPRGKFDFRISENHKRIHTRS